ncbi:hypothetical protein M0R89_16465 [Halorussus limi]|uniref:Uncharacterized protein n=1 Tax=Halorussus limi TaxID=2938695 RepID=A0A8U0HT06_9EURY|nr:hypothetical protein [Halorussus limi]UPV74120.1 hypothetical protein M0R89_16465 [Halorussus limi]
MTAVDTDLADELSRHDEYFTARELVEYLERHHPVEGPGVPRDLVEAYADELEYDRERFDTSFEDRLTDARSWQPGNRLYRVSENVSIYPPSWHEQLADTTDLSDYVDVMLESVRAPEGVEVARGDLGVAQDELLTAVEIIGDVDRSTSKNLLKNQRLEGSLVLYAFQNPEELIRLPKEESD